MRPWDFVGVVSSAGGIKVGLVICTASFTHSGKFFIGTHGELGSVTIDGFYDVSIDARVVSLVGRNAQAASICTFACCASIMEACNYNAHIDDVDFVRLLLVGGTDGCATIRAALVVSCFDVCPSRRVGR